MKTVKITDISLRTSAEKKGGTLSFKEKLEISRILDKLKVDVIELPPMGNTKADQLVGKTIAGVVKARLSAAVEILSGTIEETWDSIKSAKDPELNLLTPVSTVQMEYTCHKKAPKMLEAIAEQVKLCRFFSEKVQFTAVDATRAEKDFLIKAVQTAIDAGATGITLCDSAGVFLPDEFDEMVKMLYAAVPALKDVELGVEICSEMGVALASAAAAVASGASNIKCSAIGFGYPTLEQAALLFKKKGSDLGINAGLKTTDIHRSVSLITRIIEPKTDSAYSFRDVTITDVADVTLEAGDSISEVIKVVTQMGYELSEEDKGKVYEEFQRVAAKKHFVGTKELDAIIANTAMQVPSRYKLDNVVINSGNIITATANVLLDKNGEKLRGVGVGDGPVDAAFLAIEQIIGHHYELDDFQVQTVTEGRDAMGSALVKLRADGKIYSGNGISTDIIGASIRAYISALNKIVYDEN